MQKEKRIILIVLLFAMILLAGCLKKEALEEMDVPQNDEAVETAEEATEHTHAEDVDMVARQLYLIDAHGMVASQTIELPLDASRQVAAQALEHLVVGGPISSMLPNGFRAVLPEGTEILGLNIQEDGVIVVDVSEEFNDYHAADELRILEAMTYTLTQFDNIDRVQLRVNGYEQREMPVNGTPIGKGYTRERGINVLQTDTTDLTQSEAVTMYYPSSYNDTRYYIPVTQYIHDSIDDKYSSLIEALIDGPKYSTLPVIHVFNPQTELTNLPVLSDGVLEIEFNDRILKNADEAVISDEVMETLVRTLTEDRAVEAVHIKVKDVDRLQNETGDVYDEPVTKEMIVPMEKL